MRMSMFGCIALLLFCISGGAAQNVVDSRELGLIRIGMTMFEVQERLGVPSNVQYGSVLASSPGGNLAVIPTPKAIWFYRGNSQVPAAEIMFIGGRVQSAKRVGEHPR
jgi:hypothetical protein